MRKQDLPTSSLTNVYSAQPTSGRIYYTLMRRIQLYLFLLTNSIRCRPFSVCHSSVGSPRSAKNPREEGVMPYRTPTLANSHQTLPRNKYKHTLKQYQLWEMEGGGEISLIKYLKWRARHENERPSPGIQWADANGSLLYATHYKFCVCAYLRVRVWWDRSRWFPARTALQDIPSTGKFNHRTKK